MFGDYPLGNIRFSEQEARSAQLRVEDLAPLLGKSSAEGYLSFSLSNREVSAIHVHKANGLIDSLQLFTADHRIIKGIEYSYDPKGTALLRERVTLPQRDLTAGFQNGAVNVTVNDQRHELKS